MSMKKLFSMRNVMLAGAIACVAAFTVTPANADAAIKATPNYETENLELEGIGKKKVFFAKVKDTSTREDKIKSWDDVRKNSADEAEIDISTFIGNKDVVIAYKDGADGKLNYVTIVKAPKVKLDKTVSIYEAKIGFKDVTIATGTPLEVRKGKKGNWTAWENGSSAAKQKVTKWQKTGTTIYARLGAVNPPAEKAAPASNEVAIKIKKLANGPKLTLDPNKLVAKMKKDTEYRVNYNGDEDNGVTAKWNPVDQSLAKSGVKLEDLVKSGKDNDPSTTTNSSLIIEYRTAANPTKSKAASKITTLAVSGQAVAPVKVDNFKIETKHDTKGKKTVTTVALTPAGSQDMEYLVNTAGGTDFDTSKGWKALKKEVKFKIGANKNQVQKGSKILIRFKGQKATKNEKFAWASAIEEYVVTEEDVK